MKVICAFLETEEGFEDLIGIGADYKSAIDMLESEGWFSAIPICDSTENGQGVTYWFPTAVSVYFGADYVKKIKEFGIEKFNYYFFRVAAGLFLKEVEVAGSF